MNIETNSFIALKSVSQVSVSPVFKKSDVAFCKNLIVKSSMVVLAYNPSIWEAEDHKFEASIGYIGNLVSKNRQISEKEL
jgi:hypothetical protein